jgi:CubicO group peptidase (beta-lactamase class C family)
LIRIKKAMAKASHCSTSVEGTVDRRFERVRDEFARNFSERGEKGAACTIYHQGEKVVDLWGGHRCSQSKAPWSESTLALTFSVTKGMAAAAMAVAHSRELFQLDEPVASYWPEFAQAGKGEITVRQLFTHQAGLISFDAKLDAKTLGDLDQMASIAARQRPLWTPGTRHGYHTLTLGWYQNELIRRTDPKRRSLGQYFQDEVANPLGINFYIGLPNHVPKDQLATIDGFHRLAMLGHLNELPPKMVLAGIWPRSLVAKSVRNLPLSNPAELSGPEYRTCEIPSANGIGQARAVAKVYSVLAGDGRELGLTEETVRELKSLTPLPDAGESDAILKLDTRYNFGFSRPTKDMRFGSDYQAFGAPGAGGSMGMADPRTQIGFAYVTNKMGFRIFDDPREKAVRRACVDCLSAMHQQRRIA